MATADLLLLGIAAISVVVGGVRGFVREALSLLIWIGAFVVASLFAEPLSRALVDAVAAPALRFPIAFGTLFLATLIVGALCSRLVGLLVDATGLTGLDRVLGTAFGLLRAAVLGVVLVAVAEPLFADAAWWQASALVPVLQAAEDETFEFFRALAESISGALGR
jgi:membrane protein required for colicin V production